MALRRRVVLLTVFAILLFSCEAKPQQIQFPVRRAGQSLSTLSPEAARGWLDFSASQKLEYQFEASPEFPLPVSFELEYSFKLLPSARTEKPRVILEAGNIAWVLPGPVNLISDKTIYHYAIPVDCIFPEQFSITLEGMENKNMAKKDNEQGLQILSFEFNECWFGFNRLRNASGDHWYGSPFITESVNPHAWAVDLAAIEQTLPELPAGLFPVLYITVSHPLDAPLPLEALPTLDTPPLESQSISGTETILETGELRFEIFPFLDQLNIPAGMISQGVKQLVLPGNRIASFRLGYANIPPFPEPIAADPGIALSWPLERWRDSRYEVFRWERFPSLLIFDFADYAIQDLMLKRLAFFVEKTGFRGRLAPDAEIAALHGWNAHDYRAVDLARFFRTAHELNFPLLEVERELEQILLNNGVIRNVGGMIQEGEGGIISISRESEDYLRVRFMAHEGFHGLFFIDEDFRNFSRNRWQQLPTDAKRFITSFFQYQSYDTTDEYLLINEFMAYTLQQPIIQSAFYFGQSLPSRLEGSWRRADLPEKNPASNSWPSLAGAFTREAEAFSAYVGNRWGLSAGRVHLVTVRRPGVP
jgi:hypothetical protein